MKSLIAMASFRITRCKPRPKLNQMLTYFLRNIKYRVMTSRVLEVDSLMLTHIISSVFSDFYFSLVLRIVTDDSTAIGKLSNKFGCEIDEIPHLLKTAKTMGLNVVGIW